MSRQKLWNAMYPSTARKAAAAKAAATRRRNEQLLLDKGRNTMYTETNFKTKKAFKEAFAKGEPIRVYQPGPFAGKTDGRVALEGPHYPEPHRWYADVEIANSVVVKIYG